MIKYMFDLKYHQYLDLIIMIFLERYICKDKLHRFRELIGRGDDLIVWIVFIPSFLKNEDK